MDMPSKVVSQVVLLGNVLCLYIFFEVRCGCLVQGVEVEAPGRSKKPILLLSKRRSKGNRKQSKMVSNP